MSFNWIKITERAQEGIKIINGLPYETFTTVLDYVYRNMSPSGQNDDPDNALEELEKLVGVPRADFLLLIKTFSYILKRTSTFVIKPTRLQAELREKLQLSEDKINAIVKLWVKNTKPIMDNLANNKYESNEIQDVAWKLNVQISSHCQQREKSALAVLQLKTGAGEDINFEMNRKELLHLYNQFESIQNELDAIHAAK